MHNYGKYELAVISNVLYLLPIEEYEIFYVGRL